MQGWPFIVGFVVYCIFSFFAIFGAKTEQKAIRNVVLLLIVGMGLIWGVYLLDYRPGA